MIESKYYVNDKNNVTKTDFWTNKLYNSAYEMVKDRKFPIVIPTYNRPDNKFIKWATSTFKNDETWPIYLIVRESQVNMYEKSKFVNGYNYINVLGFPDSEIDDIGKVRNKIVEYFSKTNDCVFMFDDDITNFTYTVPYKRSNSNISLSVQLEGSSARVFAMWQIAMEIAIENRNDLIISNAMIAGFNWMPTFCDPSESIRYMSGPQTLAVCINLNMFKEKNINYRPLKGNGHDDIDLLIRAILIGCTSCEFRWISYSSPGIGTDILDFNSVEERFAKQYKEMYDHFSDIEFVKWKQAKKDSEHKNRNSKDNVGINWSRAIKYHNSIKGATPVNEISKKSSDYDIIMEDNSIKNKRYYNLAKFLNL